MILSTTIYVNDSLKNRHKYNMVVSTNRYINNHFMQYIKMVFCSVNDESYCKAH